MGWLVTYLQDMSVTVQLVKVVIKKTGYTTTNSLPPPLDGIWVGEMLFIWLQNYFCYILKDKNMFPQNFQGKIKPKRWKAGFQFSWYCTGYKCFPFFLQWIFGGKLAIWCLHLYLHTKYVGFSPLKWLIKGSSSLIIWEFLTGAVLPILLFLRLGVLRKSICE